MSAPERRDEVAVQPPRPGLDLSGFPRRSVRKDTIWYREHGPLGPWYFASGPGGRYNLDTPLGTLYLANSEMAGAKERIGRELASTQRIPASLVEDRSVSCLLMPTQCSLAYLTAGQADQSGVVANELATVIPYDVPRAWARAFHAAGFHGVWTCLRYGNTSARGVALFGAEGPRGWPVHDRTKPLREVLESNHYKVVDPPHSSQITWVDSD